MQEDKFDKSLKKAYQEFMSLNRHESEDDAGIQHSICMIAEETYRYLKNKNLLPKEASLTDILKIILRALPQNAEHDDFFPVFAIRAVKDSISDGSFYTTTSPPEEEYLKTLLRELTEPSEARVQSRVTIAARGAYYDLLKKQEINPGEDNSNLTTEIVTKAIGPPEEIRITGYFGELAIGAARLALVNGRYGRNISSNDDGTHEELPIEPHQIKVPGVTSIESVQEPVTVVKFNGK